MVEPPINQNGLKKIGMGWRIVVALFNTLFLFSINQEKGSAELIRGDEVQYSHNVKYIFETALVQEEKRFKRRFVEHSEGIWSYVPFMGSSKWADVDILLTLKIGFKMDEQPENSLMKQGGKIVINDPALTVLDVDYMYQTVDSTDHFLNKWNIKQYEAMIEKAIDRMVEDQKLNYLEEFRKDDHQKYQQLTGQVEERLNHRMNPLLSLLTKINNFGIGIANQLQFQKQTTPHREEINANQPKVQVQRYRQKNENKLKKISNHRQQEIQERQQFFRKNGLAYQL